MGWKVGNVAGPLENAEKLSKVSSDGFRFKYLQTTESKVSSDDNPLGLQYATSMENRTGPSLERNCSLASLVSENLSEMGILLSSAGANRLKN